MPVIVLASSKGGVGKTTATLTMASVLTHHGAATRIIDADPNSPINRWAERFPELVPKNLSIVPVHRTDVADHIDNAPDPYVLVDLEGSKNEEVSVAIGRADLVLIPMQGNQLDADEAVSVIKVIRKQESIFKRKIPFCVFLSMTSPVIRDRAMKRILDQLRENEIPILRVNMFQRAAFKVTFNIGGTIYQLTAADASSPSAAIKNAEEFMKEVTAFIKGDWPLKDVEAEEEVKEEYADMEAAEK